VLNLPWRLIQEMWMRREKTLAYVARIDQGTLGRSLLPGNEWYVAQFRLKNNLTCTALLRFHLSLESYTDALATMGLKKQKGSSHQTTMAVDWKQTGYLMRSDNRHLPAQKHENPVKISSAVKRSFFAPSPRQPAIINMAQGCTKDGRLTFRDIRWFGKVPILLGATTPSV